VDRDHVHVHSLWRPPIKKVFQFGKMFPPPRGGVWNKIVASGTYDVEGCNMFGRNPEITGYIMKEQHRSSCARSMVWASEFHPAR
jgi:hypothetical protein